MPPAATADLEVDPALIRRFDQKGPRYTSYPTADRFVEAFNAETYLHWLGNRNVGGMNRPLSLYFHIPFCKSICYYCACNKVITKDHGRSQKYIQYLAREIEMQSEALTGSHEVAQLHWGGGTPTFLAPDEMRQLMDATRRHFKLRADGEYSIEIDPRGVAAQTIALLAELGFNRVSIGVQDFDTEVQQAVNRLQSEKQTLSVMQAVRNNGFKSINIDLIYGLPRQTLEGFRRTLDTVVESAPDRIALYSYAHLPAMFKPQRRINEDELPLAEDKLGLLVMAIEHLTGAGYLYIGMDHFAKADDDLAVAQRQGRLHRNFQGYSTHADCDLIAFGVSAIGKIGPSYAQNVKTLDEYYDILDRGELPILRGIQLTADDLLRRSVIQALMCHFILSVESIEQAHLIEFSSYFSRELEELRELETAGLVTVSENWITVTPRGRLLVRAVCAVFDKYLRAEQARTRYSRVI
jgi:oxygen-independent coproporphyrinogen-3 oxidase